MQGKNIPLCMDFDRINNTEKYLELCQNEPTIPLFMQPHWLDAVCENGKWQVALTMDNEQKITGALVFFQKNKWGFQVITMPHLTQFSGIWVRPLESENKGKKRDYEAKIMRELLLQVPKSFNITLRFHHKLTDCSPFLEAGFKQNIRYTQVIENLDSVENLRKALNVKVKQSIKKANFKFKVEIKDDLDAFLKIQKDTFARQNLKDPTPLSIWHSVDKTLSEHGQRKIYFSMDENGIPQAALYMIFDAKTAYQLAVGSTEEGRKFGATSQLLWQAISDSVGQVETFDFLGSMMPNISFFNQQFGTTKKPYFEVKKAANWWVEKMYLLFR